MQGLIILLDGSSETIEDTYTLEAWTNLEHTGAVFLPAAGWRNETSISQYSVTEEAAQYREVGYYWSSTDYGSEGKAYDYCFSQYSQNTLAKIDQHYKCDGFSVRLVTVAKE